MPHLPHPLCAYHYGNAAGFFSVRNVSAGSISAR